MRYARFPLGRTLATPCAIRALELAGESHEIYLRRHQSGDWGVICPDDRKVNEEALRKGYRLLSAYDLSNDVRIWIITEADRSATTILLPTEY
jgi:hypothetical protein